MSIPVPFMVYGYVTRNGVAVSSAKVYASNNTVGSNTLIATTNSLGQYQINVRNLTSVFNGNTIKVWCESTIYHDDDSFVLSIAGASKRLDFALTEFCDHFYLNSYSFRMPSTLSFNDSMNITQFHFYDGVDVSYTDSKSTENITLSGYDFIDYDKYSDLSDDMENGIEFVVTGFNNGIDATYVIEDFTYIRSINENDAVEYSITLEKVR